jgi:hypothetical protein
VNYSQSLPPHSLIKP